MEVGDCCEDLCIECYYEKVEVCIENGGFWDGVVCLLAKIVYGNIVGVIVVEVNDIDGVKGVVVVFNMFMNLMVKGVDVFSLFVYIDGDVVRLGYDIIFYYIKDDGSIVLVGMFIFCLLFSEVLLDLLF